MNQTAQLTAGDRRLIEMGALEACGRHEGNESMLALLICQLGQAVSHDTIRTDLAWLSERGLVTVEEIAGVLIATLTRRGLARARRLGGRR